MLYNRLTTPLYLVFLTICLYTQVYEGVDLPGRTSDTLMTKDLMQELARAGARVDD